MTTPDFDAFDHEQHLRRACDLAREAAARGDEPFGSVLVRDDAIVAEASNRVNTERDVRRHPELDLAERAVREFTENERAATVMYTSTEPCPMCAGGLRYAGLGRIVYSTAGEEIDAMTGRTEPGARAPEILEGITPVVGPMLEEEGRRVHEAYGWGV